MLRKSLFAVLLLVSTSLVMATPSVDEIYQAAKAGKLAEAKTMIQAVLQEHPNDARAHYIYAQLQARSGDYASATTEFKTAETLAPGLPFANPKAVNEFRAALAKHSNDPALLPALPHRQGDAVNWTWLLWLAGGVVVVVLLVRAMSNTNRANTAMQPQYQLPNNNAGGVNPNMAGPYAQPPTGNSALKTGLATGLGVAAGMVAGQAIANSLFGDHHNTSSQAPEPMPPSNNDMGGNDFGLNDTSSWNDVASSDSGIDMGDSSGGDWS